MFLRAEDQAAGGRMQAVGADDEVETFGAARGEGDLHAVVVLGERFEPFAVAVVDTARRVDGVEQHLIQVAAGDLDLGDAALAVEQLGGHAQQFLAVGVDVQHAALIELVCADSGHQAHPLGHLAAGSAQVHRLATGAGAAARSITVTGIPYRSSCSATALPPMPPPDTRTRGRSVDFGVWVAGWVLIVSSFV